MSTSKYLHTYTTVPSYEAARRIVPLFVEYFGVPGRVVDLGGGAGGFLKAFLENGARTVLCIDSPDVSSEDLLIDSKCFMPMDLSKQIPAAVPSDVAVCTEFGEHVHEAQAGPIVDFLTASAPVVLFSAAVPGQGGVGHINERWPSYWSKLFAERGFVRRDVIRSRILFDEEVPTWLRQNLFVFVAEDHLREHAHLDGLEDFLPEEFYLVLATNLEKPIPLGKLVREIPACLYRAVGYRLSRFRQRLFG